MIWISAVAGLTALVMAGCCLGYSRYLWVSRRAFRQLLAQFEQTQATQIIAETAARLPKVCIVIAARNEAQNIKRLVKCLGTQTYPVDLLQVVLVDDCSTDGTADLARKIAFRYPLLRLTVISRKESNSQSPKKEALAAGIAWAKQSFDPELIITTDADCWMGPEWVRYMAEAFVLDPKLMAACGPVALESDGSWLGDFQQMENGGLQLLAAAGIARGQISLANGANLAFRIATYEAVGGYLGTLHLASGDDELLLQKMAKQPEARFAYVAQPRAIVFTSVQTSLSMFWKQRIRWGSKHTAYEDRRVVWTLIMAMMGTLGVWFMPILAIWSIPEIWLIWSIVLIIKMLSEEATLRLGTQFLGQAHVMRRFVPIFFLHEMYILIIGLAGRFVKKYEWKGRHLS